MRYLAKYLVLLCVLLITCLPVRAETQPGQPATGDQSAAQAGVSAQLAQPSPELKRPTVWGEPTEVRVMMFVIDVDNIDSANQSFSASVYYEARWKSPFLQHKGPGPKVVPTTAVWTPRLAIVNQQQAWNAFPNYVEIYPDGEVVYRQKTWGWFSQPLDLHDFPFDRQTLAIQIAAAGLYQTDVVMTPLHRKDSTGSGIAERFSLPDFEIVSWTAGPRPYIPIKGAVGNAGFTIEVNVQRSPAYYLWQIIVPLCLIVAMSWAPRWIGSNEIGVRVGVSSTAFLTLVAYLFAIHTLLPRISYFTRLDQFILLSTIIVFLGLLQTVMMPFLDRKISARTLMRIDVWSRALYPLMLATVLGVSFFW